MTRPIESESPRAAERETEQPRRELALAWIVLPAVIFAVVVLAVVLKLVL